MSAGAKAILDLPRTLELLDTLGVLVVGYRTGELPAFYAPRSGLALDHRVDSAAGVTGKRLTPFLLARLAAATGGASIRANRALAVHNAEVAAALALALGT